MNAIASKNIKFVSLCDQGGGRSDGVQVMVHRGYAYIGHGFSNGITVIDVRDAKNPKPVKFIPCPPNTRALHIQAHDDLLLAINGPSMWNIGVGHADYFSKSPVEIIKEQNIEYTSGLRIFDISKPDDPREISFMPVDGLGPHRIWYVGGRYAYVSIHFDGYSDFILGIVDVSDPTKPHVVGKSWIPGMWRAGGEKPNWPQGKRYALHHALVAGDLAYGAWRDGGLTVMDVKDKANPKMLVHRNLDPPFGGGTHSPLPLPDRNLLVLLDETNAADCSAGLRHIWMFDVREPSNPVSIATMPVPSEADYCKKGGIFGPHNLWENRPGAFQSSQIIFATYQNAGVRVYDIANPYRPEEIAFFVPSDPKRMADPRPNRPQVIQSSDCFVDAQGLMYVSDPNAGLNILQFEGA